jgi:hypothetical protein
MTLHVRYDRGLAPLFVGIYQLPSLWAACVLDVNRSPSPTWLQRMLRAE